MKYSLNDIRKCINRKDFEKHFDWFIYKFDLIDKSNESEKNRKKNIHPVRPRKGDIYLVEFGQNIGKELNNIHMGIVMQNSLKNSVSSTIIVVPISSSSKIYDTHEILLESDVIEGKLNKIPSKAKAEQISCIDKSRLIHKIGKVSLEFIARLEKKIAKNLDFI